MASNSRSSWQQFFTPKIERVTCRLKHKLKKFIDLRIHIFAKKDYEYRLRGSREQTKRMLGERQSAVPVDPLGMALLNFCSTPLGARLAWANGVALWIPTSSILGRLSRHFSGKILGIRLNQACPSGHINILELITIYIALQRFPILESTFVFIQAPHINGPPQQ